MDGTSSRTIKSLLPSGTDAAPCSKLVSWSFFKHVPLVRLTLATMILAAALSMIGLPSTLLQKMKDLGILPTQRVLDINISTQRLRLLEMGMMRSEYSISTARNGIGQRVNTYQTPLGLHRIHSKIGDGAPLGAVFSGRQWTGETWPQVSASPNADLITTRIMWLEGLEPEYNMGHDSDGNLVDSFQRYIYIHGTNNEDSIGQPASHGCIRMLNAEVVDLFDIVREGDLVWIHE
jgi:hypothetical protein